MNPKLPPHSRREEAPLKPNAVSVRYDPWIERLAWLMDSSIGIGRWTIGVDALLGLIPGFGDIAGALISLLIVQRSVQAGVPRVVVARMMTNIAFDALAGVIPVAGDLFDFAYKANIKNLRLYRESLEARRSKIRHWGFFTLLLLVLLAILAIPLAVVLLVIPKLI